MEDRSEDNHEGTSTHSPSPTLSLDTVSFTNTNINTTINININTHLHSYLPGISQSLFTTRQWESLVHRTCRSTTITETKTISIPILQFQGVVVLPYSTLPLRLSHKPWVQYVSRLMETGTDIRIGIITTKVTANDDTKDPFLGRIGTIVTVTTTHGMNLVNETNQLVVTAFGTQRFQIIAPSSSATQQHPFLHRSQTKNNDLPFYIIQLFNEGEFQRPRPVCSRSNRHEATMASLSMMTPLPITCYRRIWSWAMVDRIQSLLLDCNLFQNDTLTRCQNFHDPMAFSFYIASEIVYDPQEKLMFLELDGTFDRLLYIYNKLVQKVQQQQQQQMSYLCCKSCHAQLASSTNFLTVGGSEGISGAYVNEYGMIHQTLTVRHLITEQILQYYGRSETKDSWFPGYAWTIANCHYCQSHLGWKFDKVATEERSGLNRPSRFWGFSAASITMQVLPTTL